MTSRKVRWTSSRIKILRKHLGLSQAALSERLGVSQDYINQLESDQKSPSEDLEELLDRVTNDAILRGEHR